MIRLGSGTGLYEAQPKKEVHLHLFVMEKDKMSIRTKELGAGQPKLEELGMKRNK